MQKDPGIWSQTQWNRCAKATVSLTQLQSADMIAFLDDSGGMACRSFHGRVHFLKDVPFFTKLFHPRLKRQPGYPGCLEPGS
jgi:hypothetical protein